VNGKQITVATTDTLQGVFDKISTATSGDVTGTYDPTTDKISLTSGTGEVVLGSATDTSNFLRVMRLSNNGASAVSSSSALGSVRLAEVLASSNLATAVDDGGGAGLFKINGVEITFTSADSLSDILERINDSDAGVNASYDSVNDRFLLTNKVTGDLGVALEDVTGNFLAATGLSTGTLQRGNDLLYTLNGGGQLSSHSNTITEESSGITGLSVEALADDSTVTVTVSSDTDKISKAISDFVEAYNKAQAVIDTNTASSTDANGKVTAGTLAGEREAFTIAADLRRLVTSTLASATGAIKRLESIGINTNGDNDQLSISDTDKLETALSTNLSEVKFLFMDEDAGLATTLAEYLEGAVGDDGMLPAKQNTLDEQVQDISDQIESMERIVQSNRAALIASFVSMEKAQSNINTQLQYLSRINGS
jgi:flagellar hook-associated protein 2